MTVSSEESDAELEGTEARINASLEDLRRELKLLQSETTAELRHLASARSMTRTMVALAGFGAAVLIGAPGIWRQPIRGGVQDESISVQKAQVANRFAEENQTKVQALFRDLTKQGPIRRRHAV